MEGEGGDFKSAGLAFMGGEAVFSVISLVGISYWDGSGGDTFTGSVDLFSANVFLFVPVL